MSAVPELLSTYSHREAPWSKLRVLVAGLGVAGLSVSRALAGLGAMVCGVDSRSDQAILSEFEALGIALHVGEVSSPLPQVAGGTPDVVVASPGWRPDAPLFRAAKDAGIPIWSDLEIAWRVRPKHEAAPWLVITGTNGKTTTVQMLTAMLRADGLRAIAAGNVGLPVIDAVLSENDYEVIAVEASSFQLHRTETMAPVAAVCLNVAEDHLDWHGSYESYVEDKAKVYSGVGTAAIYNVDDPITEEMVRGAEVQEGCRAIGFTLGIPSVSQLGVVDGTLCDRAFLDERRSSALPLADFHDFHPSILREGKPDAHIVADAIAAAALARAHGVAPASIREGLREFLPDAHRATRIREVGGVCYVDDSKATNPHAAQATLAGFGPGDVVWIAGGLTKGVELNHLVEAVAAKLLGVVLIGADRAAFRDALERHAPTIPVVEINPSDTSGESTSLSGELIMAQAVRQATKLARPGATVLLSPAAASMDQFVSYGQRGDAFGAAVRQLILPMD